MNGAFRVTACDAARLASRARAAKMMRATMPSATFLFSVSHFSSAMRTVPLDVGGDLRVVELVFCLPLKLRLRDVNRQDGDDALANVLGGERDALGSEVVRLDEVAHRLDQPRAQPLLVRASRARRNAIDVGAHGLVGGFGPHQRQLDARLRFGELEDRADLHARAVADEFLQVVANAARVREGDLLHRSPESANTTSSPECR